MAAKKEMIDQAIERRQHCLNTSESDRTLMIEYIREFVEQKRGNQRRLAEASSVPESRISNLLKNTGVSPGIEIILILAQNAKKLLSQ
ncbi:XRE family transcriptional regulator (plasmid) [Leptospira interrogans serovar Canicola]|uniref:XRE family transcriptional regulator n=1 Tax=Leptospira interrogans serovar Canicola TaxID=211880 RepID=A0AAQ0B1G8_LEPIR|nr:XRE family transcriptional regulator [Leptospira interrogans]MBM2890061.1 XRE family transcriptional regulator [Leptospira interrogans]QOI45189.1 XRE family transcriptional regulator [Leptospira interrogans serovar Canicola]